MWGFKLKLMSIHRPKGFHVSLLKSIRLCRLLFTLITYYMKSCTYGKHSHTTQRRAQSPKIHPHTAHTQEQAHTNIQHVTHMPHILKRHNSQPIAGSRPLGFLPLWQCVRRAHSPAAGSQGLRNPPNEITGIHFGEGQRSFRAIHF